jgi:hypothetical protein
MADGQANKPPGGPGGAAPSNKSRDEFEDFMTDLQGFLAEPAPPPSVKQKEVAAPKDPTQQSAIAKNARQPAPRKPAESAAAPKAAPKAEPGKRDDPLGSLRAPRLPREMADIDLAALPPLPENPEPAAPAKTASERPTLVPRDELMNKLIAEVSDEPDSDRKTPDVPFPKSNLDRMRERAAAVSTMTPAVPFPKSNLDRLREAAAAADTKALYDSPPPVLEDAAKAQHDELSKLADAAPEPEEKKEPSAPPEEDPDRTSEPVVSEPVETAAAVAAIPLPQVSVSGPPSRGFRSSVQRVLLTLVVVVLAVAAAWNYRGTLESWWNRASGVAPTSKAPAVQVQPPVTPQGGLSTPPAPTPSTSETAPTVQPAPSAGAAPASGAAATPSAAHAPGPGPQPRPGGARPARSGRGPEDNPY